MKRMLNVRTSYKRSNWYDGMRLDPKKDNVLSTRNDEIHNKLRTKMAAGVKFPPTNEPRGGFYQDVSNTGLRVVFGQGGREPRVKD